MALTFEKTSLCAPPLRSLLCEHIAMSISVFVVDDHEVVRAGIRSLLQSEPDIDVIGEAGSAHEALTRIALAKPNVAVLDVRLPDGSGIEVCRDIRAAFPTVACLMLTSYADDEALLAAIMAGAAGYVLKEVGSGDLVEMVKRAAKGESLLDPRLSERVLERLAKPQSEDQRLASLTPQERKILDCIAQGWTNRQIGEELYLAEKTVKNYVSNLLAKLGMQRRTEAAVYITKVYNDTITPPQGHFPETL